MADNEIKYATFEQIATLLSNLAVNYSNIANKFYDVFYNSIPMDVTIQLYETDGTLSTYTFPNRAKDFNYIRDGESEPEGVITADKGTIYQDLTNGNLYIKKSGSSNTGWINLSDLNNVVKGIGSPEGKILAEIGTLYVDEQSATLYIKTTVYSNTGWNALATVQLDLSPVNGSAKGITSGAVYTAIQNLQNRIANLESIVQQMNE